MTSAVNAVLLKSPRISDAAVVFAGLVTGFLTPLILNFVGNFFDPGGFRGGPGLHYASGGVPFALLIIAIARSTAEISWWRVLALGVATLVAMSCAITLSANTHAALGNIAEPFRELVGGPVGGVVGSGLMALAAGLLRVGPVNPVRWLPMVAVGTVLGVVLVLDIWLDSDNVWVIFPIWQASVALVFLRTLQTWRAAEQRG